MAEREQLAASECESSRREDGRHSWVFDGDDPRIICAFCGEMRDALSDRVLTGSYQHDYFATLRRG